ncbi:MULTISPECIES: Dabb family protein [unclassified Arthrobacter]|uniref:Dabb family protein n=1 Tax=unclassified Arthrobacter TaxID=235627 RepID=UPI00159DA37D|nr:MULTISPECIES: Dabb family protein [unclassified Arthrobacter]MCQ9166013.1 Dabb family protein [Arthrobacter sp. STN4]NVN00715.1 Dabb family protein [Arthrobacter sp. SDTb3-6]
MIRHTVLFKFKADFPAADKRAWTTGLDRLRGNIPGMRTFTHGADVVGSGRAFDYAIVADFDTVDDIAAYNTHPLHEPLKDYSFPNSEQILSVDFHLDAPPTGHPEEN